MSDTPRTDAAAFDGQPHRMADSVPAEFARELERELNDQVVCNGKGAERESDLLGKVERLERDNAQLRDGYLELLGQVEQL